MLAAVGHRVLRLVRQSFGPVLLGDLPKGTYRNLTPEELATLHRAAGLKMDI
jgi:23S rRNA pseudouridine2605 synthase